MALPPATKVKISTKSFVTYQAEGFHCWPDAPRNKMYLANRHRHLFHVRVEIQNGADREIEYHDLLACAKSRFNGGELGAMSCESMAYELAVSLIVGLKLAYCTVEISEDGECGASVFVEREGMEFFDSH